MELNRMIDHTILKPEATEAAVQKIIDEAKEYNFFSVCINPCWVAFASEQLADTDVAVCTVIGFPLGANTPEVKAYEAADAIKNGANEVDMVINYGFARSGAWDKVEDEIRAVCENVHKNSGIVKVIFETSQLTLEEVARATQASIAAGADFVKTSTGFNGGGATEEAVRVMLDTAKGRIKVKPSGGIRDYERAKMFVEMGADRLGVGCNSTRKICEKLAPAAADTGSY